MKWTIALILACSVCIAAEPQTPPPPDGATRALSQLSGELRVKGLRSPVRVIRDRWGVAHIYAQNSHDLFFAQGVVAAQDRLFQMELWKRSGQGRLSEILGPSALGRDLYARALQYRGDMQQEFASYSPDTAAILAAFTDGINAYVASITVAGGPGLPVEFRLAGFAPDRWQPRDCLNRMAAFSMTGNAIRELFYARALADLGPEGAARIADLDPPVPLAPAPGLDLAGLDPDLLKDLVGSDQRIEFPKPPREGSNNWTVSGRLTATGKPLLANDPHRVLALPSLRYIVHLVAPGWDVIGAGEPALPGVALGHNEHIAWGFTIFGLDQQDLYVEELNPSNPLEYRTEAGWRTMETRRETFVVKGEAPRTIELRFTRHGPVLWDDGHRALALRWVGAEPGTAGYLASLAVDRAQNWDQFEAAVARWKVPSENIVYADRQGNVGEHSAGLAPIRRWTGLLPVPGGGGYEWTGFVPTQELPHIFNPAGGFIATANNKMIPDHYPYNVGYEWDPGYRAARITSVIADAAATHRRLTFSDMEALQSDVLSLPALALQDILRSSTLSGDARVTEILRWDGRINRDSRDAAVYEVWFKEITNALAERIFPARPDRYRDLSPRTVLTLLGHPEPAIFGANSSTGRDALLAEALAAARKKLATWLGPDPSQWSWGALHTIRFRHALDQQPDARDRIDLGPLSRPGDDYTVNSTYSEGAWEQVGGASYREILDTSDWDHSIAVNTPGQSGQPGSRHYADLMGLWDSGEYFPLVYSQRAVEQHSSDRLLLLP